VKIAGLTAAFVVFAVLATANAGGYRFGISDQSYYAVAVAADAHPGFFPRDTPLLDAQSRLMLSDDLLGWIVRRTGLDLPPVFFALYVVTLVALFTASIVFARRLGLSWWAVAAALLLLTLKHHIAKTGANTLEGYAHVRVLAFALGVAAMACAIGRRPGVALVWLTLSAVLHVTTAAWFALALAIGGVWTRPAWRRRMALAAIPGAALLIWGCTLGPLAGRFQVMDAAWVAALQDRDYLFPAGWPAYAWVLNMAYPAVVLAIVARRARRGLLVPGEATVVIGLFGLVALFLLSLPFSAAHVVLAVQLQVNRVFWLTDFATTIYLGWWLMDGLGAAAERATAFTVLGVLLAISGARGVYLVRMDAHRPLVQIGLPATPWTDAMAWLRRQPSNWHVLADPRHAWKYGVSVRLAAEKDTLLEAGKDPALGTYDRDVAMRVADRLAALAGFDRFDSGDIRRLAARYDLDVLVAEAGRTFDFPVLYRNAGFTIYDLRWHP